MTAPQPDTPLDALRQEIDAIDGQILALLIRRFAATDKVKASKTSDGSLSSSPLRPAREAIMLRRLIAEDFDRVFTQVDLIAGPVSPTVAWNLGEILDDPVRNYLADLYTLGASLAGLPGMSVPAGFGDRGRPVGLQLIAPRLAESRLLAAADRFQQATDWHLRRPEAV